MIYCVLTEKYYKPNFHGSFDTFMSEYFYSLDFAKRFALSCFSSLSERDKKYNKFFIVGYSEPVADEFLLPDPVFLEELIFT